MENRSLVLAGRVVPCRSLREYVEQLLTRLEDGDPAAIARITQIVGGRRARIIVDEESVDVHVDAGRITVTSPGAVPVEGLGRLTRVATLDLLDGYLEVTAAVLDGALEVVGDIPAIVAIGQALEILLDSAARIPSLQLLARDFRDDPCRPAPPSHPAGPIGRRTPFYPDPPTVEERRLLARLDLLP